MERNQLQIRHRKYFKIADIIICVENDTGFSAITLDKKFRLFEVIQREIEDIIIRHHSGIPDVANSYIGEKRYQNPPWAVYQQNDDWHYLGILPSNNRSFHRFAVFTENYTKASIYSPKEELIRNPPTIHHSLSFFPTDQIWIAPLLANKNAVLLHSAAVILNGQGLLFIGHSEAGKSTTVSMLKNAGQTLTRCDCEILCDDRNIVRRWKDGWKVYGTWSHGDVPDVSSASAPLRCVIFLQQDDRNYLEPLSDKKQIWKRLLATLIRPMVTAEWWNKELNTLELLVKESSFYIMHFDQSGSIVTDLIRLADQASFPIPIKETASKES